MTGAVAVRLQSSSVGIRTCGPMLKTMIDLHRRKSSSRGVIFGDRLWV